MEKAIYFARQCGATLTGLYVSQKPSRYGFDNIEDLDSSYKKFKKVKESVDDFSIEFRALF